VPAACILDGPFAQLDTQLEQFSLNPLSTPQTIISRHLLNQLDGFVSQARPSGAGLRFASPVQAEQGPMPHQDRFGFDDEQGRAPVLATNSVCGCAGQNHAILRPVDSALLNP